MRRSSRRPLQRITDVAVSLVIGLYLVALVMDEVVPRPGPLVVLGMIAGAAQGTALWWRRSHPAAVSASAPACRWGHRDDRRLPHPLPES